MTPFDKERFVKHLDFLSGVAEDAAQDLSRFAGQGLGMYYLNTLSYALESVSSIIRNDTQMPLFPFEQEQPK